MLTPFAPALAHTARVALRTPLFGYCVLLAAPSAALVARGNHDLSLAALFALLAGGAGLAFIVDDTAEPSLTPCPRARVTRLLLRAVIVISAVGVTWCAIAGLARATNSELSLTWASVPEVAAVASVAVAGAGWAGRLTAAPVGLAAALGSLLGTATATGLAMKLDLTWVPMLGRPDQAAKWWLVAAAASMAAGWFLRDPATRHSVV